ncbi:MAG: hypothetical protein HY067_15880 [Betaproteobacteria bacterium]|nr:hypothetical protein [Betaproteobacteria bacterium]
MNSTNPSAQASAGTPATRLRDLITGFVLSWKMGSVNITPPAPSLNSCREHIPRDLGSLRMRVVLR